LESCCYELVELEKTRAFWPDTFRFEVAFPSCNDTSRLRHSYHLSQCIPGSLEMGKNLMTVGDVESLIIKWKFIHVGLLELDVLDASHVSYSLSSG
jgi:hypothetical protein